jgi:hypothetical protein
MSSTPGLVTVQTAHAQGSTMSLLGSPERMPLSPALALVARSRRRVIRVRLSENVVHRSLGAETVLLNLETGQYSVA